MAVQIQNSARASEITRWEPAEFPSNLANLLLPTSRTSSSKSQQSKEEKARSSRKKSSSQVVIYLAARIRFAVVSKEHNPFELELIKELQGTPVP